MKNRFFLLGVLLLSLFVFSCSLLSLVLADYSEDLVIKIDKNEAYPSQDATITVYYKITFPKEENYEIGSNVIDMNITTSGLVDLIETNDYLLFDFIGDPAVSGRLYEACSVQIHIPNDHGDYGIKEKTYDITIDNLRDYSNVVQLKVLAVKEELSIEMDKTKANLGDNVTINVKYFLDAPSNVILNRPLNSLSIDLGGISKDIVPTLIFPNEVTGGERITIASYKLQIPDNIVNKSYTIRAFANPPNLQSDPITLDLSGSSQIPSGGIPIFSRWELYAGITLTATAIGGGYTIKKMVKKKQKIPTKVSKQLLVSNPVEGKGWRIAELNPDRSIKDGTERTLTDEEVEKIKRVTRVVEGSEYDDLEWADPKTGETITWRGPDEIFSSPTKPVPAPKTSATKSTKRSKVDKKKIAPPKKKKTNPPIVTSPAPPSAVPPLVTSKTPQAKVKPKMSKWEEKLQGGIDMINKRVNKDKHIQKALEKYQGRRIVIDVLGESSYGIDVGSDRMVMKRGIVAKSSDLYIQMSDEEMTGIFNTLKEYQEYPKAYKKYKAHPYVMLEPKKVTKKTIIQKLGGIVLYKGTESWVAKKESEKTIRGIGNKDLSFLAEIFIPKQTPKK